MEYTMTFNEEELVLLIQCLHRDMMSKHDQPEVETESGLVSHAPQHSALLQRMLTERNDTMLRVKITLPPSSRPSTFR